MAAACVDYQMDEDLSGLEIRKLDGHKGRGVFATKNFDENVVLFEENPIVCCQFPWNAACGYKACDYCLRSLETAEENVRRLLNRPLMDLPHPECCVTEKSVHVQCELCGVEYCSIQCQNEALAEHHQVLCLQTRSRDGKHPLEQLNETWKQMNYPPETSSIHLFARILALVLQATDKSAVIHQFTQFCHHTVNEDAQIAHKLLGQNFANQLEILREMLAASLGSSDTQKWLTPEGFRSLVAMVGTNGQGVGTSALAEWAKRVGDLEGISEQEQKELDVFVDKLYEDLEEETDGFLNCEGSALYSLQSKINHSCTPNAEICFLHASSRLTLRTTRAIMEGEEVCISYLTPCDLTRSRHSRHKLLRENYLFECNCPRCESEMDEEDVTSDEDLSEDEEEVSNNISSV